MSDRWFVPESFGAGIVPVSWKGVAAIAVYVAVMWTLIGAGVLLSSYIPEWMAAIGTAMACGGLTFGFFRYAATKTDRSRSGEITYVLPPVEVFLSGH